MVSGRRSDKENIYINACFAVFYAGYNMKKMRIRIQNAEIVNEDARRRGTVTVEDGVISGIVPASDLFHTLPDADYVVEADDMLLMPGMIDEHVHFREPGLTRKGDIESESRAAAAGGVTSYMDMPNVIPQTTTIEALNDKFEAAKGRSVVNYSFYFGATADNASLLPRLNVGRVCAVKLFMGSSTGNMLVDDEASLKKIFSSSPLLIVAHCEDAKLIDANLKACRSRWGDDPDVRFHPLIRSEEACFRSSRLAVSLAKAANARLHVAHISTARELELFSREPLSPEKKITAEACIPHLIYNSDDYARLGARIKCNPAIKTAVDRDALRSALSDNQIDTVATDHAPHLYSEKTGGCAKAASGMPMIQFALPCLFELYEEGILTPERIVRLVCHNPAILFHISRRGFIREGYYADLTLLRRKQWTLNMHDILSKCGWSPLENETFRWQVAATYCNGRLVYTSGADNAFEPCGKELTFER